MRWEEPISLSISLTIMASFALSISGFPAQTLRTLPECSSGQEREVSASTGPQSTFTLMPVARVRGDWLKTEEHHATKSQTVDF